jgi:hypothetical protein
MEHEPFKHSFSDTGQSLEPETISGHTPSQEKQKQLGEIIERVVSAGFGVPDSRDYISLESFNERWDEITGKWSRESTLRKRKLWVEMMREGPVFAHALGEKIQNTLEGRNDSRVYNLVRAYTSLGHVDAVPFLARIFVHPRVVDNSDASTSHTILDYIASVTDSRKAGVFVDILKALDSNPQKIEKLYPLKHMFASLSDSEQEFVAETLESATTNLGSWIQAVKLTASNKNPTPVATVHNPVSFNEEIELANIQQKEEELKTYEEPTHHYEDDPYNDSGDPYLEDYFEDSDHESSEQDTPSWSTPFFKSLFAGDGIGIDANRKAEVRGNTLLNLHRRFRPELENSQPITSTNYLPALITTFNAVREAESSEACMGFLSGVVSSEVTAENIDNGEDLTLEDAYRITMLAIARGFSVAVTEERFEDSRRELQMALDYINESVGFPDDKKSADFVEILLRQLSEIIKFIDRCEATMEEISLPETSESFLLHHRSKGQVRQIPDFRTLLSEKIRWCTAHAFETALGDPPLSNLDREKEDALRVQAVINPDEIYRMIVSTYFDALNDYVMVEKGDVPLYADGAERLAELNIKSRAVFGRDGKYFFTALKANEFGTEVDPDSALKYVFVTRAITGNTHSRQKVADYLKQQGVSIEYDAFIDTGYQGSIPEFAIRQLADSENVIIDEDTVDRKIFLLSSSNPRRQELRSRLSKGRAKDRVEYIEDRAQSIHSPDQFEIDTDGQLTPSMTPNDYSTQVRAWTVEHAVMRNFVPKIDPKHPPLELNMSEKRRNALVEMGLLALPHTPKAEEETLTAEGWHNRRQRQLDVFIERHCSDISTERRGELLSDAIRLYEVSRDIMAPVIGDYSEWVLERASTGSHVLFLARDALMSWISSRLLIRKGNFPGKKEEDLKYAYLSRKVILQEDGETIKRYLGQLGVKDDDQELIIADLGVYGMIPDHIKRIFPRKPIHTMFLISAAQGEDFEGYLLDRERGVGSEERLWSSIPGNKAVHFLEDTFSGLHGSVAALKETADGKIFPELVHPYSRDVLVKRMAALYGVTDHVRARDSSVNNAASNRERLVSYLENEFTKDALHIMVPHD